MARVRRRRALGVRDERDPHLEMLLMIGPNPRTVVRDPAILDRLAEAWRALPPTDRRRFEWAAARFTKPTGGTQ